MLVALPKMVLRGGERRGKRHVKQATLDIQRRLNLLNRGDYRKLWEETGLTEELPKRRPRTRRMAAAEEDPNAPLPESVVEAIRGLVEEGALGKA